MSDPPPQAPTFPQFPDQEQTPSFNPLDLLKTPTPLRSTSVPDMDDSPFATSTETSSAHVPVVDLPVAGKRQSVIASILLWRDPKVTAVYLGAVLVFFYMTLIRGDSVISVTGITVFAYQVFGIIGVQLNRRLGGKFDNHIRRPAEGTPLFKRDHAYQLADIVVQEGNEIQDLLRDVMYCDKPKVSAICLFAGVCLYFAGIVFSVLPLLFVMVLGLFSVPLAYEKNKKQVDDTLAKASDSVAKQVSIGQQMAVDNAAKLLEKAPPQARELAERVGLTPKKKSS